MSVAIIFSFDIDFELNDGITDDISSFFGASFLAGRGELLGAAFFELAEDLLAAIKNTISEINDFDNREDDRSTISLNIVIIPSLNYNSKMTESDGSPNLINIDQGPLTPVDILLGWHDTPDVEAFHDVIAQRLEQTQGTVVVAVESILFGKKYTSMLNDTRYSEDTFHTRYTRMFDRFASENPEAARYVNPQGGPWKYRQAQLHVLDALDKEYPGRFMLVVETVRDNNELFFASMQSNQLESQAADIISHPPISQTEIFQAILLFEQAMEMELKISAEREKNFRSVLRRYALRPEVSAVIAAYGAGHPEVADLPKLEVNIQQSPPETKDAILHLGARADIVHQRILQPESSWSTTTLLQGVVAAAIRNLMQQYIPNQHIVERFYSLSTIRHAFPDSSSLQQFLHDVNQEGFTVTVGKYFDGIIKEEIGSNPLVRE